MNVQDMATRLGQLTMLEVIALTKELRQRWGISEHTPAILQPAQKLVETIEQMPEAYRIVLVHYSANAKIPVIKLIRELTKCGLAEGKQKTETPNSIIMENVPRKEAEAILAQFQTIGAMVKLEGV